MLEQTRPNRGEKNEMPPGICKRGVVRKIEELASQRQATDAHVRIPAAGHSNTHVIQDPVDVLPPGASAEGDAGPIVGWRNLTQEAEIDQDPVLDAGCTGDRGVAAAAHGKQANLARRAALLPLAGMLQPEDLDSAAEF